jgi:hypothetical protein
MQLTAHDSLNNPFIDGMKSQSPSKNNSVNNQPESGESGAAMKAAMMRQHVLALATLD